MPSILMHDANGPRTMSAFKQTNKKLSLALRWLLWVCAYMLTARTHLGFPETFQDKTFVSYTLLVIHLFCFCSYWYLRKWGVKR